MPKQTQISKEILSKLYEKEKLSTFQIAKRLGFCQATIWKKLKEYEIKRRLPGVKRIHISKQKLENLYLKNKFSIWKIEKITKIPRGTIHRKLKEFDIKTRNRADSHITHFRKDFSGDLIEKAYLIGFRLGDLGVRKVYPNSKTICVASGSTIKEQIDLINNLFKKYGKIWIKKTKNNKINIQVFLNCSFDFLLPKEIPSWIEKDNLLFFAFIAGFTDAEGCIGISNGRAYYSLGNYNNNFLFKIFKSLNKFGINCNSPTSDNRKGKKNSQGYKYNQNYWTLRINRKDELLRLLENISPCLKHKKKIKSLNIAVENIRYRRNKNGQNK
jgi:hypothetical protein